MAYSMMPYHTFQWYIAGALYHTCASSQVALSHRFVEYSGVAISHICYIADSISHLFVGNIPRDK